MYYMRVYKFVTMLRVACLDFNYYFALRSQICNKETLINNEYNKSI